MFFEGCHLLPLLQAFLPCPVVPLHSAFCAAELCAGRGVRREGAAAVGTGLKEGHGLNCRSAWGALSTVELGVRHFVNLR